MKRFLSLLLALTLVFTVLSVPAFAAAAAPTLNSAVASGTSVTLNWSAVSGATAYYVYMGTSASSLTYKQGTTGTTVTVTGLNPGTTYYFGVKAKVDGTNSAMSNVKSVTTGVPAPTLNSAAASGTSVTLNWSAVSGATAYYVYMGTSASSLTYKQGTTGTSATVTGLNPGTTYYFAVKSKVNGVNSALSNVKSAATAAPAATLVSATGAGAGSVKITWNAVPGVQGYYVYYGTGATPTVYKAYTTGTSYTFTALAQGTTYSFGVKVKTDAGVGALSNVLTCTAPSAIPTVQLTSAVVSGSNSIRLNWNAVSGADTFYIYKGISSPTVYVGSVSGTATTYNVTGLAQGNTYMFCVYAVKNGTKGARSNIETAYIPSPPAVTLVSVSAGEEEGTVVMKWNAAPGAQGYYVYQGSAEDAVTAYKGYSGTTSYTVKGLTVGKTYWFGVRARGTVGDVTIKGRLSNVISVTLTESGQGTPGLQFEVIGVRTCKVSGYTGDATTVVIPDFWTDADGVRREVTEIGEMAFYDCGSITNVTIPESVHLIGHHAFAGCYELTEITIPGSVTNIGDSAFYACYRLASLTLQNGLLIISDYAFCATALTSVNIPASVTRVGKGAFSGTTEYTVDAANQSYTAVNGILYNKNMTRLVSALKPGSFTIPDGITEIGAGAFSGNQGLTSVTIPDSVTVIGDNAFTRCRGLTSITLPAGLTRVGRAAFSLCSDLKSITIPANVASLGDSAFIECTSLTSVTILGSTTTLGDYAIWGLRNVTLYAPEGSIAHAYALENNIPFQPI